MYKIENNKLLWNIEDFYKLPERTISKEDFLNLENLEENTIFTMQHYSFHKIVKTTAENGVIYYAVYGLNPDDGTFLVPFICKNNPKDFIKEYLSETKIEYYKDLI